MGPDRMFELCRRQRLFEIIRSAELHGFEIAVHFQATREHHYRCAPVARQSKLQQAVRFKGRAALIHDDGIEVLAFQPSVVVVDPVTNLIMVSTPNEVRSMLTRLVDFLKTQGITSIFTSLTAGGGPLDASEADVSSLMDTWLVLESLSIGGGAEPRALRAEIARHGPFQPDSRIPAHGPRPPIA